MVLPKILKKLILVIFNGQDVDNPVEQNIEK